jgi:predicted MFS family arabinose efflux permease
MTTNRWAILALCFATRVGLGFQFQALGSVSEPLAREFDLNFTEIGTLIGLYLLPGLVLSIPFGLAGRRFSDRVLLGAGLALLAVGGAVAAMAAGFSALAIARIVSGAGFVLSSIYFTKVIVDWFAGKELATAMAVLVMSWPFGIALGQVGHIWLAGAYGWRTAFVAASVYALAGAALMTLFYRPPPTGGATPAKASSRLTRREWSLVLLASFVWASFNAGYVVYLSFAERVLAATGLGALEAASIISLASWVMLFSGTACGVIADRTKRDGLIMTVCITAAVTSLLVLPQPGWAVASSLAFGLLGVAPAGLIMSLTGRAMAPEKRAFGMGVFLSAYFLLNAPAPAIAGWLYDRTRDPVMPILFAAIMFGLALVGYFAFRAAERRLR